MEAKTKATELVKNFEKLFIDANSDSWTEPSKQCALICVDEIIEHAENSYHNEDIIKGAKSYWDEVKSEIEKL